MSVYVRESNTEAKLVGGSIDISELFSEILDTAYPIGSIYMSVNSTSPATLFGGTWEQLKDRFLLGAGDSYSNGSTGGEINVTITETTMPAHGHALSSCNNPGDHTHTATYIQNNDGYGSGPNVTVPAKSKSTSEKSSSSGTSHKHTLVINNTGGGGAHNNMPPYFMIYVWKRIT